MNILVLCTGNSCRSQMMHGYLEHFLPPGYTVYSAGVETHGVNPMAIEIMLEDNIDISHHTSNHVDEYLDKDFAYVLTVCDHAKEVCPVLPGADRVIHHSFLDPSKEEGDEMEVWAAFSATRDAIKDYAREFAERWV